MNKRKIINDPVYGFVSIPYDIIFDLIEHPWFQRLRRIQQLGLTNYVYPGALHTRFHHAIGALHLTCEAIDVLRTKGHDISKEEARATCIAILLHDIGHGPYSHTLERTILPFNHEQLSLAIMEQLNGQFDGKLDMGIAIFRGSYHKPFLHQLISSQLDMDRLDYLNRDSFFTGVYEGVIGYDRIIKMLDVHEGELVIEAKGIYSIEKFLIARRLMYWQVYLHKTVLSAEQMLRKIIQRARALVGAGQSLFATPAFSYFLERSAGGLKNKSAQEILDPYTQLDDYDVMASIKAWQYANDKLLRLLSNKMINRHLFRVSLQQNAFDDGHKDKLVQAAGNIFGLTREDASYLVVSDKTSNHAYSLETDRINILYKDGTVKDVASASDQLNISVLSQPVVKYYLCYPKEISQS